jgi:hypothetical protein
MSMTYEITDMQDILVVSFKGNPGVDDIKRILDQIQDESGYSHSYRLWDFQESSFTFSQNELLDIALHASTADNRPAKVAMLVKEDLSFGVSRVYEVFRQTDLTEINVFRNKSEAVAWLRK